jgi:glycosyltransferase involved in cell wall biosynthesis
LKNKIKSTIIITAENQEKFIERCLKSCLNQSAKSIEIIIIFTNLKNINTLRKRYLAKNIIFLNIPKKINNPTQDQLFKIKQGLLISKGKYIFLLDGDDTFKKNKVKEAINSIKDKRVLFLDKFKNYKNNIKQVNKVHQFKMTNLYKTIINIWPKGVCTSCIVLNRELLNEFFKKVKIKKFNYLAIDILLTIYCDIKYKIIRSTKTLTNKYYVKQSVDSSYVGFFNKYYWFRRSEQHDFYTKINKSTKLNLDFIVTKIINFLLKVLN